MIDWLMERLKERSTWLGIVSFLTAAGVALDPEQAAALVTGEVAVAGAIAAFTRDRT